MAENVLIVDYGVGNVLSVCRAFEHCGANITLSEDPREISTADRVVLPGVGAINHCMGELRQRGMVDPLHEFAGTQRPFLGICVGMQMMFETNLEFQKGDCFGWLKGEVVEVPKVRNDGKINKIPHIGWSSLKPGDACASWEKTLLSDLQPEDRVYFVHSFMAKPDNPDTVIATTNYDGTTICAAVKSNGMTGTQFHPEKSGTVGLKMIQNFLNE
jgi:imidazole glycerol-phosphate synthase subunit HisH